MIASVFWISVVCTMTDFALLIGQSLGMNIPSITLYAILVAVLICITVAFYKYQELYSKFINDEYTSTLKYLHESRKRRRHNRISADRLKTTIVIRDNEAFPEYLDFEICYELENCRVLCSNFDAFVLYSLFSQINERDHAFSEIMIVRDLYGTQREVCPTITTADRSNVSMHEYVLSGTPKKGETYKSIMIKRDWPKYCLKKSFDLTSVDPRNFAKKVREVTIEVNNQSADFKAMEMDVYWYNRATLGNKLVGKKGKLDNGEFRYSVGRFSINKNRVFSIYLK